MCAELIPLEHCGLEIALNNTVAIHQGQHINRQQYVTNVARFCHDIGQQSHPQFALFYQDAYPFAVALFGLLHAGKHVWIPGNNLPVTAQNLLQQNCRLLGDWPSVYGNPHGDRVTHRIGTTASLSPLNPDRACLTLFTSGSGGHPKAIRKTLRQLQYEVAELDFQWASMLGQSSVAATVRHQHIYGLLFRLLWPLAAGRCFFSQMFLSPEALLKAVQATPACWVASPAQLKRLDERTDWHLLSRLRAVFSSGGTLTRDAAGQIARRSGKQVIEIYGSSESGGIGWRMVPQQSLWTPFTGIRLATVQDGRCRLQSPYLPEPGFCLLDDRISLHRDGRFELAGRIDRIVKVEEKRLSLTEMENALQQADAVKQAHCQVLSARRERIAASIVLSEAGLASLYHGGRKALIKLLRTHLMQAFETVVIPRKWLFLENIPVNPQGKTDTALLQQLLLTDTAKHPQLLYCRLHTGQAKLDLRIQPELIFFAGHFPGYPILPGVAQLAWSEYFGKLLFPIDRPFMTMEAIKFKKIIVPETLLTLTLEWNADTGKLYFDFSSPSESHSSGRLVYGTRQ